MNLKGQTVLVHDTSIDAWYLVRVTEENETTIEGNYISGIQKWPPTIWNYSASTIVGAWRKAKCVIKPLWPAPLAAPATKRAEQPYTCLLYTSDAADERSSVDL